MSFTIDIDLTEFTAPTTPNYYLVCPADYCQSPPQMTAPTYQVHWDELKQQVELIISNAPRTKALGHSAHPMQFNYVQRSFLFRFPDYINIKYIDLGPQKSTLAILSRSRYGYSDLGVNEARVNQWLDMLNKQLSQMNLNEEMK